MLHNKTNLFTIFILIFISGIIKAQYVHPIEQVDPTVSQFPVVKGVGDPGYTGDLNVNIPLLKVPGRGGLDYDIELQYIHGNGVPASESPSWVGLGWNLNQYQITCNPSYEITLGGTDLNYLNKVSNDQSDLYYLSFPGGSTAFRYFSTDQKWYPINWSAISIKPDMYVASDESHNIFKIYNDYKRFIVTDVHGTKYIFASSLRRKTLKGLINHHPQIGSIGCDSYYYVFKLTSILSSDYMDGGGESYTPGDGGIDKGNWIKVEYTQTELLSIDPSNCSYMEINQLSRVITPNYIAVFNTNENMPIENIYGGQKIALQYLTPSLDNVQLINKENGNVIKTIEFKTSYKFSWLSNYNGAFYYEPDGPDTGYRLALDEVKIIGQNSDSLPSYKFSYYPNPDEELFNNTFGELRGTDQWGLYTLQRGTNNQDSTLANANNCWMLQSIRYPAGSIDSFYYESDQYQSYLYSYKPLSKELYGGGLRLYARTHWDPVTQISSKYQYEYSLTNDVFPGFGFLSCEPSFILNEIGINHDIAQDYNTEVHYPDIKIIRPDSSIVKRFYTSAFSNIKTSIPTSQSQLSFNCSPYEKIYFNINVVADPVIHNQRWILGSGHDIFYDYEFADLYGTTIPSYNVADTTLLKEIYNTESKEFDDEPLSQRISLINSSYDATFNYLIIAGNAGYWLKKKSGNPGILLKPQFLPL